MLLSMKHVHAHPAAAEDFLFRFSDVFGHWAASLSTFCLRAGSIILDRVSGRIAYDSIFGLRAVSLCFFIMPPGT